MVRLKGFGLFFLAVMLFGLVGCTPLRGYIGIGAGSFDIISINPTNGSTSTIVTLPAGDPDGVPDGGFAVDSANDKAYLCGSQGVGYKIYTIDLNSPYSVSSVTLAGPGAGGFCFDSYEKDTLIGWIGNVGQFDIISIDPTNGSTSTIVTLPAGDPDSVLQCGFAVDSANGKAYLCGSQGVGYEIYTIDLNSPYSVSSVTLAGPGAGGLCFDSYEKDTLIGWIGNVGQFDIISIDPTNGSTSTIVTLPAGDPDSVLQCGFAVDSANDKAYLCGSQGVGYRIYTIDLNSPYSVSSVTLAGPGAGGFCFDVYK